MGWYENLWTWAWDESQAAVVMVAFAHLAAIGAGMYALARWGARRSLRRDSERSRVR